MSPNFSVNSTHEGDILKVRGRPQMFETACNVRVEIIPPQCKILLGAHDGIGRANIETLDSEIKNLISIFLIQFIGELEIYTVR